MPFLAPLALPAIAAVGGALSNTAGARTSTATPSIAPGYQSLADLLKARAMGRLQTGTDLSGYTAGGLHDINTAYSGAGTNLNAAAATTKLAASRAGSMADFLNTIPLLQRSLQNQDISQGQSILGQAGIGSTTVGAGSAVGGGFSSAAELLAYLQGKGKLGPLGTAMGG